MSPTSFSIVSKRREFSQRRNIGRSRQDTAAEVRSNEREHFATREIVTKEGIKRIPIEDDIVRAIKVKGAGIGARVGDVDLTLSGNVNAFGVQEFGGSNRTGQPILGGLATGSRFLGGASEASASYASRNGLLPAAFILNAATRQEGYDIGVTFGVYPGINLGGTTGIGANNGGAPAALRSSGVDFRQIFARRSATITSGPSREVAISACLEATRS